jgi:hypothetical protein
MPCGNGWDSIIIGPICRARQAARNPALQAARDCIALGGVPARNEYHEYG